MWDIYFQNQYKKLNLTMLLLYYSYLSTKLPLNYRVLPSSTCMPNCKRLSGSKTSVNFLTNIKLKQVFKTFYSVSFLNSSSRVRVHASQKCYYTNYAAGGSTTYSILSVYNLFSKFVSLLFNVFFYRLKILYFGSNSTKNDILAINWCYLSPYKHLFRYSAQSVFFSPNKMNDKYPFLFPFWKLSGYNISIVYDVTYHLKTLYYLHRFNFFSIGFIPSNLPKYKLSLAIPVLNDSWATQLFLLRLTTSFITSQKSFSYHDSKKSWRVL